jgi:hypothetical protein
MTVDLAGYKVLIDDEDYEKVMSRKWHIQNGKYLSSCIRINKKNVGGLLLHRFITDAPKAVCVDHINGNTFDNRKCNLRFCSDLENNRNKSIIKAASGYRGVYQMQGREYNRFNSYVSVKDIPYFLGSFATPEAAAYFREMAVKELYGEFYRSPGYEIKKPDKIKEVKPLKTKKLKSGYQMKVSGKVIGIYSTEEDAVKAGMVEAEKREVDRAYKQFWSVIARIRGDKIPDNDGIQELINTLNSIQKTERLIMENDKATSDDGYSQFSETKEAYMKIISSCNTELKICEKKIKEVLKYVEYLQESIEKAG